MFHGIQRTLEKGVVIGTKLMPWLIWLSVWSSNYSDSCHIQGTSASCPFDQQQNMVRPTAEYFIKTYCLYCCHDQQQNADTTHNRKYQQHNGQQHNRMLVTTKHFNPSHAAIKISINATAAEFICKNIFPTPVLVKKIIKNKIGDIQQIYLYQNVCKYISSNVD